MTSSAHESSSPWYSSIIVAVFLIVLSPFIVIFALVALVPWLKVRYVDRPRLLRRVKHEWMPNGKDVLIVYSDNPAWKDYVFTKLLPQLGARVELLNWSEHASWKDSDALAPRLFKNYNWGTQFVTRRRTRPGAQDFNRQVIIFRPRNKPEVISFRHAFQHYERGDDRLLKECEKNVLKLSGNAGP